MKQLKGVCIGAGYFSHFQYEAWTRIPEVTITALCNRSIEKAQEIADKYGIPAVYSSYEEMFDAEKPDFVDIITPPETHLAMCKAAADRGIHIICQKPMAPTFAESQELVSYVISKNVRLMIHENFRFQPWHREIKKIIDNGEIGDQLFSMNFRMRMGDGWQPDAYMARQAYFRAMPRLLIFETGVHFIDTFRFLAGEITSVYGKLRKLNPDIAGEDAGYVFFDFANKAQGVYDANRYNESSYPNPRYTFGDFLVEGNNGSIRLFGDGRITIQPLGKPEKTHAYTPANQGFAGDCVYAIQRHFIDRMMDGKPFETSGEDYLRTMTVQEAIYDSHAKGLPIQISY